MAWLPISGTIPQYSTINNALASDYYLKFYAAGTATPINMATDSTGGTLLAKCALSTFGCPITNPLDISTRFIPHIDQNYRIVLFKNEADADSNNTAEAAFNIDGMALQIAPSADATDISLRDTNVEVQDDYDRSPIFVANDGFTAGAGPHVVTVPTVWTPTNAGMRFYKVDASGIITTLTPTSTSATTFTLTETLLSTDSIFIGDDTFRSLNIATQAEANESKGSELITVKTLAGRLSTETMAGIVEKATSAELLAGTANKFPDSAGVKGVYGAPYRADALSVVWTGSATSVDMDALAGGWPGDGFYVIVDSSTYRHVAYLIVDVFITNATETQALSNNLSVRRVIKTGDTNILSMTIERKENTTASSTAVTITSISKVI
jgi:hypothetical protein